MSILSVYQDTAPEQPLKVLTHLDDIAATLSEVGIHLERWDACAPIGANASQDEVIAAYRPQIDQLMRQRGCVMVDVLKADRNEPQKAELCARFLNEHRYAGDEVRFFVAGRGLLNFHIENKVYAVLCERNDLISVPAGTRHWFDMGAHPHVAVIRLINDPKGWSPEFTGEDIAVHFPRLDDWQG